VRSEDAAIDVRLVDDHVPQVREHVPPAVVVGQHAHMEHVGVGQDDVRRAPDLAAVLDRGVAVVDRRAQAGQAVAGERPELVLG
jgi:hypothetical protein